jgi:hypothetical protein
VEATRGGVTRLTDLPRAQWFAAADGCAWCGAPYEVRLVRLPRGGWWGEAEVRADHRVGCVHGVEDRRHLIGWQVSGDVREFLGRRWPLLVARASMSICLACGGVLVMGGIEVPVDPKAGAVEVCPRCAQALGWAGEPEDKPRHGFLDACAE